MKKLITIIILFAFFCGFSQKNIEKEVNKRVSEKVAFRTISVFSATQEIPNSTVSKVIDKATFAQIKMTPLSDLMTNKYENIELEVPYQGEIILVQLYKVNLLAEGFHVDTDKAKSVPYEPGLYYRGIVKGDNSSVVSFNFFNNECNGIVSSDRLSNLVVGKLDKENNVSDYIIYKDSDLKILNQFDCKTKDIAQKENKKLKNNSKEVLSARCVTMYFEIDNNLYVSNGSNVTTTTNWMTSVFNNVQTLFTNDGITTSLKSTYIWTSLDPYTGANSSDYLNQFNVVRPVFDGDVGQLVGIDPGGLGGVAVTIDGLCNNYNFSYNDVDFSYSSVPTYSWTVEVVTHELGHLLGSRHTHGCYWNGNNTAIDGCGQSQGYTEGSCAQGPIPTAAVKGSIMSYCHLVSGVGINFNNGFGPQPKAAILANIQSKTCLSLDCINTCINSISSVTTGAVSNVAATINWAQLGGPVPVQISVFPLSSGSGAWNTSTNSSFNATGLTPNTYYKAVVRNSCSGGLEGAERSVIFVTPGDFCSGIQLTDTGGASGNYSDNETVIRTIVPNNTYAKAKITFSSFNLEQDYDYLYIYNGPDTTYPDLSAGGFTGSTIPNPIESTATDGSLTLKFYSDGGVVAPGYVATISCLTLGVDDFTSAIDFTYYPNPTNGLVSIKSKNEMSEVFVYNPQGQLLSQQKINGVDANVDLSSFAKGTYLFKLKFDDKVVNFKVLKLN
ncbi:MAG: M57 family metalloprotease [Flavobacterium sp.]